jgi:diaminopimelate epimerase
MTVPTSPRPPRLLKGHGTENDFLVLPDLDGELDLTAAQVRALCDRRAGIGADGVLRVVRSENVPEAKGFAERAPFFMDYRNADGSIAEMCGNGIRVLLRYLQRVGVVEQDAAVATRGGILCVRPDAGGDVSVEMGQPRVLADRPVVTAALTSGRPDVTAALTSGRPALAAVRMPNPHVVVRVPDVDTLEALDLSRPPTVDPAQPDGQNVEFVVVLGPRHLRMRVHERGSGETRSCGTGICAAVVAVASADGPGPDGLPWRVDVPGGTCSVTWDGQGVTLTGPAVISAEIELDADWWRALSDGTAATV